MYQIKFPIGDWSGDGHSKCEWFILESNKPLREVRDTHLKSKEVLGFDIGELCSDYCDSFIDEKNFKLLLSNGILIPTEVEELDNNGLNADNLIDIWVKCLMKIDSGLILTVIPETVIPSITSYVDIPTYKYIRTPGYGLFD